MGVYYNPVEDVVNVLMRLLALGAFYLCHRVGDEPS